MNEHGTKDMGPSARHLREMSELDDAYRQRVRDSSCPKCGLIYLSTKRRRCGKCDAKGTP